MCVFIWGGGLQPSVHRLLLSLNHHLRPLPVFRLAWCSPVPAHPSLILQAHGVLVCQKELLRWSGPLWTSVASMRGLSRRRGCRTSSKRTNQSCMKYLAPPPPSPCLRGILVPPNPLSGDPDKSLDLNTPFTAWALGRCRGALQEEVAQVSGAAPGHVHPVHQACKARPR